MNDNQIKIKGITFLLNRYSIFQHRDNYFIYSIRDKITNKLVTEINMEYDVDGNDSPYVIEFHTILMSLNNENKIYLQTLSDFIN